MRRRRPAVSAKRAASAVSQSTLQASQRLRTREVRASLVYLVVLPYLGTKLTQYYEHLGGGAGADDVLLDCTKFILGSCPRLPEECLKLCAQSTFWDVDRSWDDSGSASTASKNLETKRWLVVEGIGLGVLSKGARQDWMQEELFQGRCFLHYAAGSTDVDAELLEMAIKQRPHDINIIDCKGLAPLELALGYRCIPDKVKLLLRCGANPALCYGGERAREDVDRQIEQLAQEDDERSS